MTTDGRPTTVDDAGQTPRPRKTTERRAQTRALVLPETMTVQYLAEVLNQNPIDVIKQLMRNGIMASMNQVVDYQVATLVTTSGISRYWPRAITGINRINNKCLIVSPQICQYVHPKLNFHLLTIVQHEINIDREQFPDYSWSACPTRRCL